MEEGVFSRVRQGHRSAIVRRNGKEQVVALSDIRDRKPQRSDRPTEEEIRGAMVAGTGDTQENKEEKEGKATDNIDNPTAEVKGAMSDEGDSTSEDEDAAAEGGTAMSDDDNSSNGNRQGTGATEERQEPGKEKDVADFKEEKETDEPEEREESENSEETEEEEQDAKDDGKTARTWNLLIAREDQSGKVYAALDYRNAGKKLSIMKRVARRRPPAYHPVWWTGEGRNQKQRCQMKCPGTAWKLWNCKRDCWTIIKNLGQVLSEKFEVDPIIYQEILNEMG